MDQHTKMASPAKYLFDQYFEDQSKRSGGQLSFEQRLRAQFDDELAQACEAAFAKGRAEGAHAAQQSLDARIIETMDGLLKAASTSKHTIEKVCASIRADSLRVALTAADKLASGLMDREPALALEKLFEECIDLATKAPHVAIRVNETIAEQIQSRVDLLAQQKGFAGQILVIPDPDIAVGDGQLDWADGGVSHSYKDVYRLIEEAINRYLKAPENEPGGIPKDGLVISTDQTSLDPSAGNGTAMAIDLGETA